MQEEIQEESKEICKVDRDASIAFRIFFQDFVGSLIACLKDVQKRGVYRLMGFSKQCLIVVVSY